VTQELPVPARDRRHGIGRRLILQIIAFSSLITLLITAAQLAFEYQGLRRDLDRTLDSVAIYLPVISNGVWDFDERQTQLALDALARLPGIGRAVVRTADAARQWSAGKPVPDNAVVRIHSLRHLVRGVDREIGTLEVTGSLNDIYRQVAAHALSIALSNALKTFLVVAFMVVLLRRLVTRRLEALAGKVIELVPRMLPLRQAVETDPQPMPERLDELEAVAWAFDNTARDLHMAVDELHRLNEGLERRVRERTQALEAANQDLQAFSYTLSHDLKAPLLTIASFSSILKERHAQQLDEKGRQHLARVQAAADRMDGIVGDTLRLFAASALAMEVQAVDLSAIASETADELARSLPQRAVEWEIEEAMQVQGDAQLLRMALDNLMGNAWKYTARQACPRVRVGSLGQADGTRTYFIEDNGAGFDMSHAKRLFQPFERLHHEPDFPGNGVGLSAARRIIQRHGGSIWARSEPGRGATFYFTLSAAPASVK
jgi:signal transduction histidine kinase